ncbi:nucleotidyltransferase substrate binding protein [Dyadobacter sp. CY345]|uniref:nucleotidyltransferase substrate binding protein n=1 Tax=Dyadobacter sp. CY345 TaxID=2909335 RepID=UPI001F1B0904|nr:nucleotidyltransferase substrate binding protein [Dyadobacter sp. CY345]MCF2445166.1 nucleotidyltransferase substrate binding protein [Dyadobacter sp. CY345]
MDEQDVRWKQRFQNLEKSLSFLELAIKIENPDIIQKAGLIQFFEISFELSWNVLKDYLEDQGFFELRSPRDTIKKAFQVGLITDGHLWIQALQNRNLTAHTYDEKMADQVADEIRLVYYPLIQEIYTKLKLML